MINKLNPIRAIGMPWHGLAEAGVLPQANSPFATYTDGSCILVKPPQTHPRAGARTADEQADDAAKGHSWPDYALLCGNNRNLGGSADMQLGQGGWLYCDGAGSTWWLDLVTVTDVGANLLKLQVWLRRLFGRFPGTQYGQIDRMLTEYQLRPSVLDEPIGHANPNGPSITACYVHGGPQPTPDGRKALVNVMFYSDDRYYYALLVGSGAQGRLPSDSLRIDVTGDGSLGQATLGNGIGATVTRLDTIASLHAYTATDTGAQYSTDFLCGTSGTGYRDRSTDLAVILFRYYDASGVQQEVRIDEHTTDHWDIYHSGDPASSYYNASTTQSGGVTIGAHSRQISRSAGKTAEPYDCISGEPTTQLPFPTGESLSVAIHWLGSGVSGYFRQFDNSFDSLNEVVGWHGLTVDQYDPNAGQAIANVRATSHPVTGQLHSNYGGALVCWV